MYAPSPPDDVSGVTVVMLTYGDRLPYLRRSLARAREEGGTACILVDNGADPRPGKVLTPIHGEWLNVITVGRNAGPAAGNALGIRKALDDGAAHILLLDDDNILQRGSLEKLMTVMRRAEAENGGGPVAVIGYRRHLIQPTLDLVARGQLGPGGIDRLPYMFLGFDILSTARRKLGERFGAPAAPAASPAGQLPRIPFGPYGGCLLNRAAVEKIGFPDERYCLYFDDTEYTHRMAEIGAPLIVVPEALIDDIDDVGEHQAERERKGPVDRLTGGRSERGVYYLLRNRVFWERHVRGHGGPRYCLNAVALIVVVGLATVLQARFGKARLFARAIRDGLAGRMGESPHFKLP